MPKPSSHIQCHVSSSRSLYAMELKHLSEKKFWGQRGDNWKIHWLKWETMCKPKSQGGLGFKDLSMYVGGVFVCRLYDIWKAKTKTQLWAWNMAQRLSVKCEKSIFAQSPSCIQQSYIKAPKIPLAKIS